MGILAQIIVRVLAALITAAILALVSHLLTTKNPGAAMVAVAV